MGATVVVGLHWGDEGKGKLIDLLANCVDIVIRYQGGDNAGHTVVVDGKEFVFHQLPSGILHCNAVAIADGALINPKTILDEFELLKFHKIDLNEKNIYISESAHVIFPYHVYMDKCTDVIGTTHKGIGLGYADKVQRRGIRFHHLKEVDLCERIQRCLEAFGLTDKFNAEQLAREYSGFYEKLKGFAVNCKQLIHKYLQEGKKLLFEGAQGTLLDIDHGTYPYVTASNTTAAAAAVSGGFSPKFINKVIGVMKSYMTRVGEGPLITRMPKYIEEQVQQIGREYGATTGRPRKIGWFDVVATKYAMKLNGVTNLVLTKMDTLSYVDEIKVCTKYIYDGEKIDDLEQINDFIPPVEILQKCTPVYETLAGWKCSISHIKDFEKLPPPAKNYIHYLQEALQFPIDMVCTGRDRKQYINLNWIDIE